MKRNNGWHNAPSRAWPVIGSRGDRWRQTLHRGRRSSFDRLGYVRICGADPAVGRRRVFGIPIPVVMLVTAGVDEPWCRTNLLCEKPSYRGHKASRAMTSLMHQHRQVALLPPAYETIPPLLLSILRERQ